jgi:hypothetical protein
MPPPIVTPAEPGPSPSTGALARPPPPCNRGPRGNRSLTRGLPQRASSHPQDKGQSVPPSVPTMPEARPAGPLPIVATFERAFRTLFDNARPMAVLALLFVFVPFVLARHSQAPGALGLFGDVYSALSPLPMLVAYYLGQAILIRYAIVAMRGEAIDAGADAAAALCLFPRLLAVLVLSWLGVALLTLLGIVPGVMLFIATAVAIPVLVDEQCGARDCLRRSLDLTRGSRWRIALILVLMCALFGVEAGLLTAFQVRDALMLIGESVEILVTGLLRAIADLILAAVFAAIYVALRERESLGGGLALRRVFA